MYKTFLVSILLSSVLFSSEVPSPDKGLTYYKFIFKDELGYSGNQFVDKFFADEWRALFANNGEGFKKEFRGRSEKLDQFLDSSGFDKVAPHLEAFAIYYAKGSGYSPHCHNDIDTK